MKERSLTEKQKRLCEGIAKGLSKAQAALDAGYDGNVQTRSQGAIDQLKKPEVAAYLQSLTDKTRTEAIADISRVHEIWSECLNDTTAKWGERLHAGELLAKCRGEWAAEKHDVSLGGAVVVRYPRRPTETP